jgi:hypothetical protein
MTRKPVWIVFRLFITAFYLEYTCGGSGVVTLCTYVRRYLVLVLCVCLFMSEHDKNLNDLILKYDAV